MTDLDACAVNGSKHSMRAVKAFVALLLIFAGVSLVIFVAPAQIATPLRTRADTRAAHKSNGTVAGSELGTTPRTKECLPFCQQACNHFTSCKKCPERGADKKCCNEYCNRQRDGPDSQLYASPRPCCTAFDLHWRAAEFEVSPGRRRLTAPPARRHKRPSRERVAHVSASNRVS
ncbi:hypothetical protein T492DRAFT_1004268 [Pavlovales sp. CCMP2436]|nr:hypothetical protein T492DRAFT_1004268 [Pavlovales sp. CCMP2436]